MKKSMNRPIIAQVVSHYPPHIGGMQKVAAEISHRLARIKWPINVLTSNMGADAPAIEIKDNYLVNRLKSVEFAHTPIMRGLFAKLFSLPKRSIIHLHIAQAYTPEVVWLVSKIRRIPYIAHFHLDVPPSGPLGFLFLIYKKLFLGIILRDAHKVIVSSPGQADLIRKKYFVESKNIAIIPNAVNNKFCKFKQRSLPQNHLKLLFVGRLCVQKRVDRLLDALAKTSAPIQLIIVGDGEKRVALERQAKNLGLNNVTFVGNKTSDELVAFYQNADAFVLPSDIEAGMPLVALEAMATGLPVIGANVLGVREFINDCGITAHPSPQSFAKTFEKLWGEKHQLNNLSHKSFTKAKRYSWDNFIKKLEPIYKNITKEYDELVDQAPKKDFSRTSLTFFILLWASFFATFKFFNFNPLFLNVIGFSFLLFVPGLLTYLVFNFPKDLPLFGKLALAVTFSLLELISVAIFNNTFLPLFGITKPLNLIPLTSSIAIFVVGLLLIAWYRLKNWRLNFNHVSLRNFKTIDWLTVIFPLLFIALSIIGAISLNNGGTNSFTIIMIIGIGIYFIWLIAASPKLNKDAITIAIYSVGLSLLFMTSMRGWYITGHDVQKEFLVFSLAKNKGIWDISSFRDAYNASLSITLLPTIFANLLTLADEYIYKVYFQLIFAITPSIVFLIVHRYLKPSLSILAAFWFMAFPTFFSDMPMLNRQEIAFLVLALMLWVIFEPTLSTFRRQFMFIFFGSSIVLLHYSTIYSIIAILFFSIAVRWSLPILKSITKRTKVFNKSSIPQLSDNNATFNSKPILTFPILIIFIIVSFAWVALITNTESFAGNVINQTIKSIPHFFERDTRSSQVLHNLFSWRKTDSPKRLKQYINEVVKSERKDAQPGLYLDKDILKKYPVKAIEDEVMPLTKTGRIIKNQSIDVATFNFFFRQGTAKILQILVIIGFMYLLFKRRYLIHNKLNIDLVAFAAGSLLFMLVLILMPVISTAYGLLRAFQQALMVLSLFLVIGSLSLAIKLPQKVKVGFAYLLAVTFFLSTTGLITQTFGGYYPQLNLNNNGVYYDLYYLHRGEIIGVKWVDNYSLKSFGHKKETAQLSGFEYNKLASYASFKKFNISTTIYPALIEKKSFVFLEPQTLKNRSSFAYQGDIVTYKYPVRLLDKEKDLIYNNGQVKIYK